MFQIPVHVHITILPFPTLPVAEFLHFPFPSQLPKSLLKQDSHVFRSSKKPNFSQFMTETLKDLPIPLAVVLSALQASAETLQVKSSILYAHLPNE
jgi:hypothetical protein